MTEFMGLNTVAPALQPHRVPIDSIVEHPENNRKGNVLAIAQGSSEVSISMVVDAADTELAVKSLHELIVQ